MTELDGVFPPWIGERLPPLPPSRLTAEQQELYDAIIAGDRATGDRAIPLIDEDGSLAGPFNAMLYSPTVGRLLESIGRTLRYQTELPARLREIAILTVAASEECSYEWIVHSHQALLIGLSKTDLEVISGRRWGQMESPEDQRAATIVREILETGNLTDLHYGEARQWLGDAGLLELVVLVSHYRLLALILRIFKQSSVKFVTFEENPA